MPRTLIVMLPRIKKMLNLLQVVLAVSHLSGDTLFKMLNLHARQVLQIKNLQNIFKNTCSVLHWKTVR